MDHYACLEKFRVGDAPLQRFPWLGYQHGGYAGYESCTFAQYPVHHGFPNDRLAAIRDSITKPLSTSLDAKSDLAFLQSWFFVGVIEHCLGCHISEDEFVQKTGKGAQINTKFLRGALDGWTRNMRRQDIAEQRRVKIEIQLILAAVQDWTYRLRAWAPEIDWLSTKVLQKPDPVKSYQDFGYNLERVCCLVALVGESLSSAKSALAPLEPAIVKQGFLGQYTDLAEWRLVWRLVQLGWCPYIARILISIRYTVAEYATFQTFIPAFEKQRHRQCTPSKCVGYSVDTSAYKTQHIKQSCKCRVVTSEQVVIDVKRSLNAGSTPVLDVKIDEGGEVILDVVDGLADGKTAVQYAAISHVWSDGLGSTTESGMPSCQVWQLFQMAAAQGLRYVWIDALCVPSARAERMLAIQRMAQTYANSASTIVIDKTMKALRFHETGGQIDTELMLLRFATAPWMMRIWTLQEALLSPRLVFCLKDCTLAGHQIADFILHSLRTQVNPINQTLGTRLADILSPLRSLRWEQGRLCIGSIARMLRLRSISRREDETLAVAGLLEVDVDELLKHPSQPERMKSFLRQLHKIPSGLLFTDAPRMSEPGWRWAAQSLLPAEDLGGPARVASTFPSQKYAGKEQMEVLPQGGAVGTFTVLKLPKPVRLRHSQGASFDTLDVRATDILWRVMPSSTVYSSESDFEFDMILTTPGLRALRDIWLGVAVLTTGKYEDYGGTGAEYVAYQARVILRDLTRHRTGTTSATLALEADLLMHPTVVVT